MATPADISASLTMDDIPVKLRCAACNKLAHDAFRMPCCDQSICGDCQASLPEACPVCLHEPVKADDCRPNKALRTTVRIFLKKKGMERDAAKKKEMLAHAAAMPASPAIIPPEEAPAPQTSQISAPTVAGALPNSHNTEEVPRDPSQAPQASNGSPEIPTEAQKDIPQMSVESPGVEITVRRDSTQLAGDGNVGQEKGDDTETPSEQQQSMGQNEQWASMNGMGQGMNNGGFAFDGANGLPSMGFNGVGDFSQMMPFLPSGMPNPMMAAFPNMMGMSGMGMDPLSMSQGLYGGFSGQGMGMNGMNMGMGFDAGQVAFGGFNGQSAAWNAGQNKFNQNAYGGHASMNGGNDFGTNAGYGGYNVPPHQGNYNQMHHHQYPNNDFHHGHHGQGFQNRGRGRGRGYQYAGRGRGGYNQVPQGNNQTNYEAFHQQIPPQVTRRGSPQYGEKLEQPTQPIQEHADAGSQQDAKPKDTAGTRTAEEQLNKELAPGDADDNVNNTVATPSKEEEAAEAYGPVVNETKVSDQPKTNAEPLKDEAKLTPIQSIVIEEPSKPDIPAVKDNVTIAPTTMPPPGPMIPTGPAADQSLDSSPRGRGAGRGFIRDGFRPSSQGRGSGYPFNSNLPRVSPISSVVKPVVPPVQPKGLGVEGAPTGPKALREGQPNTGLKGFSIVGRASAAAQARPNGAIAPESPSRERSRSPTRHQSSYHRHHRHRSSSPSDENEREKRRERHRRHSRKREGEDDSAREVKGSRARDASADSSTKRSSHRSRRDHNKGKDSERSSHRSHRHHRDRSKDTEENKHHNSKKRSPSPEITINGASRVNAVTSHIPSSRHRGKDDESTHSSKKRRSDDEDHRRERKRSRRDLEEVAQEEVAQEKENGHRSRHSKREEKESRSNHDRPLRTEEKPVVKDQGKPSSPPKGPKIDQHALEREARNAERVARENQRRALQLGSVSAAGKGAKVNGKGRRMSYKYEDDESIEARTSRVEKEREALRFR